MELKRGFASDNNAGVHPDILAEISRVNKGHTIGYGDDIYTHEAEELFRIILGPETEVFLFLLELLLMCWGLPVPQIPGTLLLLPLQLISSRMNVEHLKSIHRMQDTYLRYRVMAS